MELVLVGLIIFVCAVVIIELTAYGIRNMRSAQRVKIRKRLRKFKYVETGLDGAEILKKGCSATSPS